MNYSLSRIFWGCFIIGTGCGWGINPLASALVIGILYGLTDLAEERRDL